MPNIKEIPSKNGGFAFRITISQGSNPNGTRKRFTKTYSFPLGYSKQKAKKEVEKMAWEEQAKADAGFDIHKASKTLFGDYGFYVIEQLEKLQAIKPTTADRYNDIWPTVAKALGKIPISNLTANHLTTFYADLFSAGQRRDAVRFVAN